VDCHTAFPQTGRTLHGTHNSSLHVRPKWSRVYIDYGISSQISGSCWAISLELQSNAYQSGRISIKALNPPVRSLRYSRISASSFPEVQSRLLHKKDRKIMMGFASKWKFLTLLSREGNLMLCTENWNVLYLKFVFALMNWFLIYNRPYYITALRNISWSIRALYLSELLIINY